jgi:LysM repeat protein
MKLSPVTAILFLTPLLFASCRSSRTSADASDTGTPGHNMSRKDYPFDENGNYHEEWARGEDSGKVVDLTKDNPPSVFLGTTDPRDEKKSSSQTTASKKSKTKTAGTSTSKSKPKVVSKPKPSSTTITVKKGDTLYGLALRHKTTVKAIQAANGMGSSTSLRDGKSLRIPR